MLLKKFLNPSKLINILRFCVGGTLTTSALAVLAARDEHPAASFTLFTTLLDCTNTGILDVFIDEGMVEMRENTIVGGKGGKYGMMSGLDLGNTFSCAMCCWYLRHTYLQNDLIARQNQNLWQED